MLEIAMDGIKIDFGWIHTSSVSGISQALLRDILYDPPQDNFSSAYASRQRIIDKAMAKLLDNVEKIDN